MKKTAGLLLEAGLRRWGKLCRLRAGRRCSRRAAERENSWEGKGRVCWFKGRKCRGQGNEGRGSADAAALLAGIGGLSG
jgi:hypothetical protein